MYTGLNHPNVRFCDRQNICPVWQTGFQQTIGSSMVFDNFTVYIGLPIVCTMVHPNCWWACVTHYFSFLYYVVCLPFICLRPVCYVPYVANVSIIVATYYTV